MIMPRKSDKARKLPSFLDPLVAAAATHPTRIHALSILSARPATAGEIGRQIGRSTGHVSYHLEQLEGLGLIEIVETKPAHGGRVITHSYRATQRVMFDQGSWEEMDDTEQAGVTITILSMMSEDINNAVIKGTINEPSETDTGEEPNHISRIPMALDTTGWNAVAKILEETLERILVVQEECAGRSTDPDDLILNKVHLLQFRSPDPH